ncbi:SDR family NAD(P)-dependent oxidoreductase [Rhodococcus jostii]|uniref:NAD(P)-dependent dehydrogenase, short-chain alcohol dehydrogenase family n=1 Tax=Rhodococcus jostii TaxID=132919 RepID=A0A1H5M067_RHOJO|nr:SDR family NAD(P)-dependent oxidoreductase [Rhodococcus jostii]SEE82644.1 NAD(P)-dependent dehydrogenase, short-chain alcohol dehydrogenase family [Rhodococcus jostii]
MGALDGKVALITGAGRGMGASHAKVLAAKGAAVVMLDGPGPVPTAEYAMSTAESIQAGAAEIRDKGGRALAIEGDVRSQDDLDGAVAKAVSEFGKLDLLVANAGIWGELAPIWEMSEEAWQETININLSGPWRTVKAAAPQMIENGVGSIVLISSVVGIGEGLPGSANYASAKHGVIGLLRTAAMELGPLNIRVNAVCPGFIRTGLHGWQGAVDLMAGHPGGTEADLIQAGHNYGILKGRGPLEPGHVSETVAFLLSDEAWAVTGTIVPVDAGHTILPRINPSPAY